MKITKTDFYQNPAYRILQFTRKFIWMQIHYFFLTLISFMINDEGHKKLDKNSNCKDFFYLDKNNDPYKINPKTTDEKINFPLNKSAIVITDIVESTSLYNLNPYLMKKSLDIHYKIVYDLVKKHMGHIVANEGDSFQLIFKKIEDSIDFCKEFFALHTQAVSYFQVRIGIGVSQGRLFARRFYGYKIFGSPINEILGIVNHNCGNCICIKKSTITRSGIAPCSLFCIH